MSNPHYLKPSSNKTTPAKSLESNSSTSLTGSVDVSNIPINKLELGTALIIGVCGFVIMWIIV